MGQDARVLQIISAMVALAVRMRLQAREERRQLEEENVRLHIKLKDRRPNRLVGDDKRMREVYAARYTVEAGRATLQGDERLCAPAALLEPELVAALGYPEPPAWLRRTAHGALRARAHLLRTFVPPRRHPRRR